MNSRFDFAVVGGGLVGLATSRQLLMEFPDCSLALIEKECDVGQHQSGRNSGVLHSGIYYKPGSIKATTCKAGKLAMEAFCQEHRIAFDRCGKVIVATDEEELPRLVSILERGVANGIECRMIDAYEINQLEPNATGLQAIYVPTAGIVDYQAVCQRLKAILCEQKQMVQLQQRVVGLTQQPQHVTITTHTGQILQAGFLISCGGLYSDRLVEMSGAQAPARIIPFRGEYYQLNPGSSHLCRNLIYPVPDPNFPFLGVHFTRMTSGQVECGPNAVLALAREGYSWKHIRPSELWQSISYPGFLRVAGRYWPTGLGEIKRSLLKSAFVSALQRLVPSLRSDDLQPCRSGVRAQAVTRDGTLVDDFLWVTDRRCLHVCNAPSPAATASLEIARCIVNQTKHSLANLDSRIGSKEFKP